MDTQVATTEERTTALAPVTPEGERFALRQRQARMFAMSPLVPEHLRKGSTEQAIANCWIALTLAEAMGEVPLIVMQNIHVVNGKAGFASQYMIARANNSGVLKGRIDWRIDRSDPNNLAVTAFAFLKETGGEISVTCDMKMAKAEGWTKNSKYSSMPEVMLRYRSAAFLVRFYAPDVMLGYQTTEEIEDVGAAATPSQPALNARMLIEQSQPVVGQGETQPAEVHTEEPPHDPDTGEIIEGDANITSDNTSAEQVKNSSESEREEGAQREPTPAEDAGLDEPHPAQAKADDIISEIKAASAIIDVNSIVSRHGTDLNAMPEAISDAVRSAAESRKKAINAERARAPAREAAE